MTVSLPEQSDPDRSPNIPDAVKTGLRQKPTRATKLAYAVPYLAVSAMMAPMTIELKIFYTDTVLVPAGLLALATAIARAFDAITDPLMGWVSDHTQTRWGRRKPWLPVGIAGSALFFWLLFSPPENLSPVQGAIWAGSTFLLYYLFHTVWIVPYHALGLELSPDYDDRTRIFGLRAMASGLGLVSAFAALYILKQKQFVDERETLFLFSGVLSIIMMLLFIFPLVKIKEHSEFSTRKGVPLISGIRAAFRNRPFKKLLTVYILMSVTASLPPLLMPYFTKYVLELGTVYRIGFALVYVSATFIAVPIWMGVARHYGKVRVWISAASIGIITSIGVFFVGEGQVLVMGVLEFIRGIAAGSVMIVGPAMLADITDYDELLTGKRREAQFGSFISLAPKFVAILSATLPLAVLGMMGYNPVLPSQPSSILLAIRCLYALLPVAFHILVLIVILKYPINREMHLAIRRGIAALERGEAVKDPISGKILLPIQKEEETVSWFLDFFSIKELHRTAEKGSEALKKGIVINAVISAVAFLSATSFTVWLLVGSLSNSAADQLKQGVGSCMIVIAGISLTATIFHLLRIRAAEKMKTHPVDPKIILHHIANLQHH